MGRTITLFTAHEELPDLLRAQQLPAVVVLEEGELPRSLETSPLRAARGSRGGSSFSSISFGGMMMSASPDHPWSSSSPTSSSPPEKISQEPKELESISQESAVDEGFTTIQQEEAASTREPVSGGAGPPPPVPVDANYLSSSMSPAKEAQSIALPTITQESSSADEGHQAIMTKVQQEQTSGKKPASAFRIPPPVPAAPPPPLSPLSSSGERSPQESSAADDVDVHQADGARKTGGEKVQQEQTSTQPPANGAPPPPEKPKNGAPPPPAQQLPPAPPEPNPPAEPSVSARLTAEVLPVPQPDRRTHNATGWAAFGRMMGQIARPRVIFNGFINTKLWVTKHMNCYECHDGASRFFVEGYASRGRVHRSAEKTFLGVVMLSFVATGLVRFLFSIFCYLRMGPTENAHLAYIYMHDHTSPNFEYRSAAWSLGFFYIALAIMQFCHGAIKIQANKEALMFLLYRAEIEDMPAVYHNLYGLGMGFIVMFFPVWNRSSIYRLLDDLATLITPMVTLVLPGYMLMRLTSPARPHHKFVRADILLLADAMVENDFSEDEEIEEEKENNLEKLKRMRDKVRQKVGPAGTIIVRNRGSTRHLGSSIAPSGVWGSEIQTKSSGAPL